MLDDRSCAVKNRVFDGGETKVEGTFTAGSATGSYRDRYRLKDARDRSVRVCHTGKQEWEATKLTRGEWRELRDYG